MAAVICGCITGYLRLTGRKTDKKIIIFGAGAGFIISAVIAFLRNNTSHVNSAVLNSIIYMASLGAFLVFLVLKLVEIKFKGNLIVTTAKWVAVAVFVMAQMAYSLPEVMMFPHQILITEKTAISTDFLLDMIGIFLGLIICLLGFLAAMKCSLRLSARGSEILMILEMLTVAFIMQSGIFSVNLQNGNIKSNHTIFSYVVFVKNHSDYFIYISLILVFAVSVILLIRGTHVSEPYRNPAEHRKIKAKWRNIRKWAVTAICIFVLTIFNLTAVEAFNSREVTLSPVEDAEYDTENVYVTFEQVSDGHLHRFAYETENGVNIRFIVIQKPNSSTYGIGLDACDICGETGYYERDGQVVCKLCDVVMNINTIGFKGGCNPIVIPYEIKNGRIIVPISGLLEYEKEFK